LIRLWQQCNQNLDDEQPINPFDFWTGANFKLKLVKKDGYWNYDKSEFASPSALLDGDDDELESIYKSLNNLNDFTDVKEFKSYDDLKKRLEYTLGLRGVPKNQDPEVVAEEEEWERERRGETTSNTSVQSSISSSDDGEDEDDALSYFQKLAES